MLKYDAFIIPKMNFISLLQFLFWTKTNVLEMNAFIKQFIFLLKSEMTKDALKCIL